MDDRQLRRFYFVSVGVSLAVQIATLAALIVGVVRLFR